MDVEQRLLRSQNELELVSRASEAWRGVRDYKLLARHAVGHAPNIPKGSDAKLMIRLLIEETLELAEAVGIEVRTDEPGQLRIEDIKFTRHPKWPSDVVELAYPDDAMVKIMDSLADVLFVAIGAAVTCGCPDTLLLQEVTANNMIRVCHPDYPPTRDPNDGKVVKNPKAPKPNFKRILELIGWITCHNEE